MEEKLIDLLGSVEGTADVHEQGSFTDAEHYPEHFFTYWIDDTEDVEHYDNKSHACVWYFTINFYSTDPLFCTETLQNAIKLLKENGWIVNGKGKAVYSDSKNHSGRSIEATYIEKEETTNV